MSEYIAEVIQSQYGEVTTIKERLIRCKDCRYWIEVSYGHVCDWTMHQKQSGEGFCELARNRKEK